VEQQTREDIAGALLGAYSSRIPVEPVTGQYDDLTVEDAYEIRLLQVADWTAAGAQIKGHKVGLTSAAMQRQLGVDRPDYGHLLEGMFWPEHEPIPVCRFLQPRVEPETAFVLARPLRGPGVTIAEAIAAVGFVLPALELIDSRFRDWKIGLANTLGAREVELQAGQVILPGSVTAAIPVSAGDTVTATFAGLGGVTARFSAGES
jgi:2-keto-4-pentenoate hydratase